LLVAHRRVLDGFQNQFFSTVEIEVHPATLRAHGSEILAFEFGLSRSTHSSDGKHNDVERGALGFRTLGSVREGLLKSLFDNPVHHSNADLHARYAPSSGPPLHGLDDSIAHAKFMHLSSVPR
jgi:hypothetical protein